MKPLRRPAALDLRLMSSPRASAWSWLFVLAEALPVVAKPATGPGALLSRRSLSGGFHAGVGGTSQVPR